MGLGVLDSMLGPTMHPPPMPEQASLFRSGVPLDSPLEDHSLWDLAFIALCQELSIFFLGEGAHPYLCNISALCHTHRHQNYCQVDMFSFWCILKPTDILFLSWGCLERSKSLPLRIYPNDDMDWAPMQLWRSGLPKVLKLDREDLMQPVQGFLEQD